MRSKIFAEKLKLSDPIDSAAATNELFGFGRLSGRPIYKAALDTRVPSSIFSIVCLPIGKSFWSALGSWARSRAPGAYANTNVDIRNRLLNASQLLTSKNLRSVVAVPLHVLNIMTDMTTGAKTSRFVACTLVVALYALTLTSCVVNLAGQEAAEQKVIAPASVQQSALGEAKATKTSGTQHKKAAAEASSMGSKMNIALPDSNLLVPPPEPNCELGAPALNAADPRKLDYELQCYRAAEVFARSRLLLLQNSVDEMIKAIPDTRPVSP